mmetsp:Transcript_38169/g.93615  ORF Transcript_38169/g.93615 Transcript_38169/m.93615 type:complete len:241 (-) Transcript_38169:922-1644(-)
MMPGMPPPSVAAQKLHTVNVGSLTDVHASALAALQIPPAAVGAASPNVLHTSAAEPMSLRIKLSVPKYSSLRCEWMSPIAVVRHISGCGSWSHMLNTLRHCVAVDCLTSRRSTDATTWPGRALLSSSRRRALLPPPAAAANAAPTAVAVENRFGHVPANRRPSCTVSADTVPATPVRSATSLKRVGLSSVGSHSSTPPHASSGWPTPKNMRPSCTTLERTAITLSTSRDASSAPVSPSST